MEANFLLCTKPHKSCVTGLYILRAVRYFDFAVLGAGVRDSAQIFWGKDVMHSRLSAGAIAPAARKIIKRLTPERQLNSTEIYVRLFTKRGVKRSVW
jgi:hypothetical protein